jgi:Mg2+ and Co2+ transporter CorA
LHSRYGYYGVLLFMLVVASGMLLFFWKRGWIGRIKDEG